MARSVSRSPFNTIVVTGLASHAWSRSRMRAFEPDE